MTITQYEPAEVAVEQMAPSVYERLPRNVLVDGFSSGDHKVIGRLWILGATLFGLFVLIADILVRLERIDTSGVAVFSNRFAYEQWFTLHRAGLVFLFVVPLLIGIATAIVPLQIGSPSVAFPRASAAAFWTWAVSGVMMVVSWAIDGGLIDRNVDVVNQPTQLSMLATASVVISLLVATMVIATTIFTERSQGMSLYNVPMFTWSMLVASAVWLLSLPVLVANLIIMWVDARGPAFHSFGGDDLYGQISWAFDQPQVFAYAIPVLGIIAELVPVAVRRRLKNYDLVMFAIGMFGALSFGAWAQMFFNPSANTTWLYVVGSVALLLPVLALIASLTLTVRASGRGPAMSGQLTLGVLALLTLLAAGAVAGVRVLDSLLAPLVGWLYDAINFVFGADLKWIDEVADWLRDSFDEVAGSSVGGAMVQLALIAAVAGCAAALFYWAPKLVGRKLPTGAAMLAGLALFGGALVTAIPDVITGFMDQPDFALAAQSSTIDGLNVISWIGSLLVFVGFATVAASLAVGVLAGAQDADDPDEDPTNPWGGHTLEWLTASPPPPGNFAGPYVVTSEAPLLDDDFVNPYAEATS